MTFTVTVLSEVETRSRLREGPEAHPDHIISIRAPRDRSLEGLETFEGNLLELRFWDTKFATEVVPNAYWDSDPSAPTLKDVQKIIEFGKRVMPLGGELLVHCEMGISRSTAAALIVLATGSSPSKEEAERIRQLIYDVRPIAKPNNLLLEMADTVLDWDGHLANLGGWRHNEFIHYGDWDSRVR